MTPIPPDQAARRAAVEFAQSLVANWQAALGIELLGVYLIGSLVHGGFSRRYSDVDMAVIAEAGLRAATMERVRGEAAARSAE